MKAFLIISISIFLSVGGFVNAQADPYLWLEDITGPKSMEWVKKHNKATADLLTAVPVFNTLKADLLQIYNNNERIPNVEKKGKFLYNFWQDRRNIRGVYRRTTLDEYRKENPEWETILDIDALAKKEKKSWVFKGTVFLPPKNNRILVLLSRGGADANEIREYDIPSKSFVKNGFYVPESKSLAAWKDRDTLFISADFGKDSFTKSGYPRIIKLWKRGTPLEQAKTVYTGPKTSDYVAPVRIYGKGGHIDIIYDGLSLVTTAYYLYKDGKTTKIPIPVESDIGAYFMKQLVFVLQKDWTTGGKTYKQGSVLMSDLGKIMKGKPNYHVLIEPGERLSISSIQATKNTLLVTVLDNVVSKVFQYSLDARGSWKRKQVPTKDNGTIRITNAGSFSDDFFISYQGFLTPPSLYYVPGKTGKLELLKNSPHFFDSSNFIVRQYHAVSKDGTKIPYFVVMKKNTAFNRDNPTLLYGYGGFQLSLKPRYIGDIGKCWLQYGGVYVSANIRGGGEFGPEWHRAGILKNRHKVFDDFIAVAEDLVKRKITSPAKLAIKGLSNGGLLMGAVFTKRPGLFKAVLCQVAVLDMKRYHVLLSGGVGIAEYGNPDDPDMWKYMKTYSPYHNIKKGVTYPHVLFTTSTRDDRVHPGHSRKMAQKMIDMGHKIYYYENTEGGHAAAADNQQRAYGDALNYAHLHRLLMGK